MFKFLISLSRKDKQALLLFFDVITVVSCIFAAFSIRLGYLYYPSEETYLLGIIFLSPIIAIPIFSHFGLYHTLIRYVTFESLWRINQAVALYSISWGLLAFMVANWEAFPRSVVLINWVLVVIIIGGSRLFARWLLATYKNQNNFVEINNVLIYGAGSAGRQLSRALSDSLEYRPIAFIDDSAELYKHSIAGLKVYSQNDLQLLIEKNHIKEVLLAIPSLSRIRRKEIVSKLEPYPVIVRSLPSVSSLAQGKVKINDLLEIDLRDLLGRDSVKPNKELLETNIFKKVVLVSGAGGSIGAELCRQIILLKPKKLILFDISESSLYVIEQELLNSNPNSIEIFPIIGSVTDKKRMKVVIHTYGVQTIYHAAAYKHVPLVEFNPSQGIINNAIGTKLLAEVAISEKIETFVLISTDKAVRPTSIMGASKRIAELILQALDSEAPDTCLTMVRFGNVLDSSGSVIPLFKKQIKAGGPLTVTHADIVRYFMTIPEAVELVLQAGAMAKGGEVFLLDMGEPVKIYDLAVKMIKLSGLSLRDKSNPDGDIEIHYTGLRPGEKLFEELLVDGNFSLTENELIMQAREEMINWNELNLVLMEIEEAANNSETKKILKLIKTLIPEFQYSTNGIKLH